MCACVHPLKKQMTHTHKLRKERKKALEGENARLIFLKLICACMSQVCECARVCACMCMRVHE